MSAYGRLAQRRGRHDPPGRRPRTDAGGDRGSLGRPSPSLERARAGIQMTSRTRERMSEEDSVNPCDPSSSDPPRPEQERTAAVRQAVETLSAMPWDVLRRWRGGRGTAKPRPGEAQRTVRERDIY